MSLTVADVAATAFPTSTTKTGHWARSDVIAAVKAGLTWAVASAPSIPTVPRGKSGAIPGSDVGQARDRSCRNDRASSGALPPGAPGRSVLPGRGFSHGAMMLLTYEEAVAAAIRTANDAGLRGWAVDVAIVHTGTVTLGYALVVVDLPRTACSNS